MALKIKYMYFRGIAILLIILLITSYINSQGFQLMKNTESYSISGFLKGGPIGIVEYDELESCKEIRLQTSIVQCKADPTKTEPTNIQITNFIENPREKVIEENDFLRELTDEDPLYTTRFDNDFQGAKIEGVNLIEPVNLGAPGNWIAVFNAETNAHLCDAQWYKTFFTTYYNNDCRGVELTKGLSYLVVTNNKEQSITIGGGAVSSWLFYSNPDKGQVDIRMPGTEHCYYGQWKTALEKVDVGLIGVPKPIENIKNNQEDVDDNDVKTELENPGTFEEPYYENPAVFAELEENLPSARLQLGVSWEIPYTFIEKTYPIRKLEYSGYLAECRFDEKRVVGFYKENIPDTDECYYRPDASATLVDGTSKDFDGVFCCSSADCLPLGGDWACNDEFKCEKGATPSPECVGDDECPDRYWTRGDGSDFFKHGTCTGTDPETGLSTCEYEDIPLACNPTFSYPDGQCCKDLGNGFELLPAEECVPPQPIPCEDTWGTDACCLETQDRYSIQLCGPGLECCGAQTDGIGQCKESCDPPEPKPIFQQFIEGIQKLLGTTPDIATMVGIIFLIFVLLFVLKAIIPSFGFPLIRGPPPHGGGGGPTVIVLEK